jgi:single-stranded DNA-binding protein
VFRPSLRESVKESVNKGQRVHVMGRIMYGKIEDKLGVIRDTTTIVADDIIRFA